LSIQRGTVGTIRLAEVTDVYALLANATPGALVEG
jgi:hypothetical protein